MNEFHEFVEAMGHFPKLSNLNNNAPGRGCSSLSYQEAIIPACGLRWKCCAKRINDCAVHRLTRLCSS